MVRRNQKEDPEFVERAAVYLQIQLTVHWKLDCPSLLTDPSVNVGCYFCGLSSAHLKWRTEVIIAIQRITRCNGSRMTFHWSGSVTDASDGDFFYKF
jgi:hypothetical protein